MKRLNNKGFSMVELLVVLLIIGILAAIAAPMFLTNTLKAKVAEGVSAAGAIRSAERTYNSNNGSYFQVLPGSGAIYFGTGTGNLNTILGVQIHGNKYFSPDAYDVSTTVGTWGATVAGLTLVTPVDFLITITGNNSLPITGAYRDGAANPTEVANYVIKMDNTGLVIYTTDGVTWKAY